MKGRNIPRRARGFSLLELVIVLIILGTIMAFLAPRIFGNVERANQQLARAKMEQLSGQLEIMRLEVGRYPNSQEGLRALLEKPAGMDRWNGPYVKDPTTLRDPWGDPVEYRVASDRQSFVLRARSAELASSDCGSAAARR